MPRTNARDTRTAILEAAEAILQRRSFNSFSYQHISEELGLRKASLHYHFPCKTDLGVALLQRYRQSFEDWRRQLDPEASPREQLQAYLSWFEACLERSQVCAGGVLGVEFNTLESPMRAALKALYGDHYAWLADVLRAGREEGALRFAGAAEDQATLVSATIQGALQQGRSCGPQRFRQAVEQLLALMQAATREGSGRQPRPDAQPTPRA